MKHNIWDLTIGQAVILDKRYEVEIISFTPNGLFAKVKAGNDEWEVVTYRLKPIGFQNAPRINTEVGEARKGESKVRGQ